MNAKNLLQQLLQGEKESYEVIRKAILWMALIILI